MFRRLAMRPGAGLALVVSVTASDTPLAATRTALEEWVQTRHVIARTRADWAADQALLEQDATLLERELAGLREQLTRVETNQTAVAEQRAALLPQQTQHQEAQNLVRARLGELERQVRRLEPVFPPALLTTVQPLLNRLPSGPAATNLALALGVGSGAIARANQDLETLASRARHDLRAALDELTALRSQIEAERLPMGQRLAALEQQVLDERTALQKAQRDEGNQLVLLGVLRTEVNGLSNEVRSLEALLTEYRRAFESRLSIAEHQQHRDALKAAAAAADSTDLTSAEKLARQLEFVGLTLQRLEHAVGGERFAGRALTPAGVIEPGTFLVAGPAAYFVATSGTGAGVVEQRLNSVEPNTAALPEAQAANLNSLVTSGTGELPLDVTSGSAVRLRATQDSLTEHMSKGGPVMVPILLLGAFAVGVFALKWYQVARVRVAGPADLKLILTSLSLGHREKALKHARSVTGPVGEMLGMAIHHSDEPKEYVEEVMYEQMLTTKPRLERFVPFLALSAAAAPLLGLLGTVTGMINTFNMITVFGTGDPKTLAGGISEALITTEYGLIVAIPSLLLHAVISRKVKGVLGSMEQTTVAFINGLPEPATETANTSDA